MKNQLMEEMIKDLGESSKDCDVSKKLHEAEMISAENSILERQAQPYRKAGFDNAEKLVLAKNYIAISERRIFEFLERKKEELTILKYPNAKEFSIGDKSYYDSDGRFQLAYTFNFQASGRYHGILLWKETLIAEYNEIPPMFVLERLKEAKITGAFDFFTVATIKLTCHPIPTLDDPLLIGRINNNSKRWIIAQWDYDLRADDL